LHHRRVGGETGFLAGSIFQDGGCVRGCGHRRLGTVRASVSP
jgi:hypothetical protein